MLITDREYVNNWSSPLGRAANEWETQTILYSLLNQDIPDDKQWIEDPQCHDRVFAFIQERLSRRMKSQEREPQLE